METAVVLNNVLKTNIAIITFFFGIKNKFYTFFLFVAMVTKFYYLLSLFYDVVAMATTGCTK